jgi:tetratricopeptide (TPR) repeat protein/tRNA A-37 threonylcarbamoyl transferase component Bud32
MHHRLSAEEIFHAARAKSDPAERAGYLDGACGDDVAVRAKVEALLKADAEAGEFLRVVEQAPPTSPSSAPTLGQTPRDQAGDMVGRYKLLQQIGEGGFGVVYMAEQREPVKRRVALKIIKLGMDTRQVIARFEAERQALAMMDHPNIAKVLDAGSTQTGRPYFVMEYIKGVPILEYCDTEKLDIKARLELFTIVCSAIQHAHQKGLIHRDIKPSNVLVTMHDGVPAPKVIDFGIAKATSAELTTKTLFTEHRQMIGTPAYMSPEQAEMSGLDIDTRSDIYSLGVLLYELLTGTTPFAHDELMSKGFAEIMRIIREVEPQKPSTRLSNLGDTGTHTALQRRAVDPKRLSQTLKGDLDWIVMRCLEKDRTRRYETANGLAMDIRRHLGGEPVVAAPPSAAYRARKFVRRHRLQLTLTGTVALLVLGGAAVAWWQMEQAGARRETELRRRLEDEQRSAADRARLGRNAEAVDAFLSQCEDALRSGDAAEAGVALAAARRRSAEGGAEDDAPRLGRLAADLTLLRDLHEIDLLRWTWSENRFPDPALLAKRTQEALARFRADPDAAPADVAAARVSASAVRERIVPALDRRLRQERTPGVRAVLQRVDADPYRDAVRDAVLAGDQARLVKLAQQDDALHQPSGFAAFMGECQSIPAERRCELLQAAVTRWPGDVDLLMALGTVSYQYPTNPKDSEVERMRWFQAAIAADPANTAALNDLGGVLAARDRTDAAIGYLEKAIALDPTLANAHSNLGNQLRKKGRLDEAIECYRKAVELSPTVALTHDNLGIALAAKGRFDEAIECFQRAVACDPTSAVAYSGLSVTLSLVGRTDEAMAAFGKAAELDPTNPNLRYNQGLALQGEGRLDEAIACFRKTIEMDPEHVNAYGALGNALRARGQLDEAIASFRKSIELDPKNVQSHLALGAILCDDRKDYDGAIACFETALALDPKRADACTNMAVALFGKDEIEDAIGWCRKAIELDPGQAMAHYGLACGLLALSAGQGEQGAQPPDPVEGARLRQQALGALREALNLLEAQLNSGNPVDRSGAQFVLRFWQQDADLAGLRDKAALARLPAEEQKACIQLWADVATLLEKTEAPAAGAPEAAGTAGADRSDPGLAFLEETFERQKAERGPDHPDTLKSMDNLARAYLQAGKLDRALPLLEKELELTKARLGRDDPATLRCMEMLASALVSVNQLDRAIALSE